MVEQKSEDEIRLEFQNQYTGSFSIINSYIDLIITNMYKQLEEKTILKLLKPYSVNHSKFTSNIDLQFKKMI